MTGTRRNARRVLPDSDQDPIDAAIERRHSHRALRRRLQLATRQLEEALGDRRDLWARLEELLNELSGTREGEYFELGFEHGFAAGRSDVRQRSPNVRELAARLKDVTIQTGIPREDGLAALLEAALSLVVRRPVSHR